MRSEPLTKIFTEWQGIDSVISILVVDEDGLLIFSYPVNLENLEAEGAVCLEIYKYCRKLLKRIKSKKFRALSLYCGKDEITFFRLKSFFLVIENDISQKSKLEKHLPDLFLKLRTYFKESYPFLATFK
jgi:predicted regulator of Ras-like GTPase activity (Roadblock/LC7/MglB family)